jgi:hypothetical protein
LIVFVETISEHTHFWIYSTIKQQKTLNRFIFKLFYTLKHRKWTILNGTSSERSLIAFKVEISPLSRALLLNVAGTISRNNLYIQNTKTSCHKQ